MENNYQIVQNGFHISINLQFANGIDDGNRKDRFNSRSIRFGQLLWGKDNLNGIGGMFSLYRMEDLEEMKGLIKTWFGSFNVIEITSNIVKEMIEPEKKDLNYEITFGTADDAVIMKCGGTDLISILNGLSENGWETETITSTKLI